jgi:hypothetical protein
MSEGRKPKNTNSEGQKELDRLQAQFEEFDQGIKDMTVDRMNMAPKQEVEQQTKISQQDLAKSKDHYLKPEKSISVPQKFNERLREKYNFAKEYVNFIAENKEIVGEVIELWTHPFGGMPAEFWKVPVNKSIWAPRYVAEQIKSKYYHRLVMQEATSYSEGLGKFYGSVVADTTIQRLDAIPVSNQRSVFMGATSFS